MPFKVFHRVTKAIVSFLDDWCSVFIHERCQLVYLCLVEYCIAQKIHILLGPVPGSSLHIAGRLPPEVLLLISALVPRLAAAYPIFVLVALCQGLIH